MSTQQSNLLNKIIWMLVGLGVCLSAQTLRLDLYPGGYVSAHYGSAHSVIYGQDGNIYAVGGAPGAGKGITFEKTYGAQGIDELGRSGQQTSDNGYVILGSGAESGAEILLLKTDIYGDIVWPKTLGQGIVHFAQQTTDEGYIITGDQKSNLATQGGLNE
uniref:Uncharacterized protein n=1 Tax=candidate division WOR-3 bacterium TaxID=2052148 RepID=A0A7V3VV85_UNCW3